MNLSNLKVPINQIEYIYIDHPSFHEDYIYEGRAPCWSDEWGCDLNKIRGSFSTTQDKQEYSKHMHKVDDRWRFLSALERDLNSRLPITFRAVYCGTSCMRIDETITGVTRFQLETKDKGEEGTFSIPSELFLLVSIFKDKGVEGHKCIWKMSESDLSNPKYDLSIDIIKYIMENIYLCAEDIHLQDILGASFGGLYGIV